MEIGNLSFYISWFEHLIDSFKYIFVVVISSVTLKHIALRRNNSLTSQMQTWGAIWESSGEKQNKKEKTVQQRKAGLFFSVMFLALIKGWKNKCLLHSLFPQSEWHLLEAALLDACIKSNVIACTLSTSCKKKKK